MPNFLQYIQDHLLLFYKWVAKDQNAAITFLIFLLGLLGFAVKFFWKKIIGWWEKQHKYDFSVIKKSNDRRMDTFFELYQTSFTEDIRYLSTAITECLDTFHVKHKIRYQIQIAEKNGRGAGFAIQFISRDGKIIYVPYFSARDISTSRSSTKHIISKFLSRHGLFTSDRIFVFEVDSPKAPDIESNEIRLRNARIRLFKEYARQLSLSMKIANYSYVQPSYHTDSDMKFQEYMELVIISKRALPEALPKITFLGILEFLYIGVYWNCGITVGGAQYQDSSMLMRYFSDIAASMPDTIQLT